ncbi:MAG: nitrate- and nitrite sensing domain-containing protein, partial [Succinivibrio sp.]
MNFLRKMTVKSRIMLLIAVPTIALLLLIGKSFISSYSYYRNMSEMVVALQYVKHIVPVISDMIDEQDETSYYIKGDDSIAASKKQAMLSLRTVTDKDLAVLNDFIDKNRDTLIRVFHSEQNFNEFLKRLNTLNYIRKVADEKKESSDAYKDVFYGQTIWAAVDISRLASALSDTVSNATSFASYDPDVVNVANAYYWILKDKIAVQNLHNEISNVVNNGSAPYNFGQIMHYRALYLNFTGAFHSYADETLEQMYKKAMSDTGLEESANSVYWKAFDSYQLFNAEDRRLNTGTDWNSLSDRIENSLNTLCDNALNYLLNMGEDKKSSAAAEMATLLILSVILIVIVELFAVVVLQTIVKNLSHSREIMTTLAKEKNMTMKLDDSGSSELAQMAKAFNHLVRSFNDALLSVRDQLFTAKKSVQNGVSKMSETHDACNEQQSSTDTISAAMHQMST